MSALVEMRSISKRFGHITALTEIDLDLYEGEVLALLGDNGAGKSTLIKVLTGVYAPSSGEIHFEGRSVSLTSPSVARDLGMETVYQDLALIPRMSIARNFYLGRELTKQVGPFRVLDRGAMNRGATEALREIGIDIRDTDEPVGSLSGGERQSIAIGRAVHFGSQVLILDEPTSARSIGETRKVLGYIASARERGMSVIFITHNLQHVFEVADRLAVVANGTKVGDFQRDEVTEAQIAEMITS